jgi:branched-chain amino acid aminotransferase
MTVQISINKIQESKISDFNPEKIEFGKVFTDHMVVCDYKNGEWLTPQIVPFGKISVSPALSAIHYGQSIFEGLKAYKNSEGEITMFRPLENAKRLNKSAQRMSMPELPEEIFMACIEALVSLDSDWIPASDNNSLYLRPFMFATDEFLGIRPSDNYKFMVYACPVGDYYSAPVKVYVEEHYSRASRGGVGAAKCAGNYAASLYPAKLCREKGYDQVLWTDPIEHKYLEETGTSNIFVKCGNFVYTPPLSDSILPGITRDSVITLLKDWGYNLIETQIAVQDIIDWNKQGILDEMFVSGTAATVINIQKVGFKDFDINLDLDKNLLAEEIKKEFSKLRTLKIEDRFNWITKVQASMEPAEA